MIKLYDTGAYLVNGTELVEDSGDAKTDSSQHAWKRHVEPGRGSGKYHCLSYSEKSQYIRKYGKTEDQV